MNERSEYSKIKEMLNRTDLRVVERSYLETYLKSLGRNNERKN